MNKDRIKKSLVKSFVSQLKSSGYFKATTKNVFTDPLYRRSVLELAQIELENADSFDPEYREAVSEIIEQITKHYE